MKDRVFCRQRGGRNKDKGTGLGLVRWWLVRLRQGRGRGEAGEGQGRGRQILESAACQSGLHRGSIWPFAGSSRVTRLYLPFREMTLAAVWMGSRDSGEQGLGVNAVARGGVECGMGTCTVRGMKRERGDLSRRHQL